MKFLNLAAAAALAFSGSAVLAQDNGVAVGAKVFGPQGGEIGTVEAVADGIVTVDTGKHKAPLPANAFGPGENGPTISVTKAQIDQMLDEQVAAAAAQRDAALVAGAMVHSPSDVMLGTIGTVEGDAVVLQREAGPVALKREHFAVNQTGTLIALFTEQQIEEAAAASATPTE